MILLKKLILPLLTLIFIAVVYFTYFTKGSELGLFSNFDTNNNANKEIRVRLVHEKGIKIDQVNNFMTFYAADKDGTEILVQAPLTENINSANAVILNGHLHSDHFHATQIELD